MFKRIYDNLIAEYVKRTGKKPEGIDLLKLKLQAQEEARQAAKVVEFKPRPDSPYGKPGGWMPTEEEAEGIMSRLSSDVKNLQKQAQELKEMGGKGDTLDFMIDYFGLDPNIKKGKTKAGKINYEEMQKKFPSVELFGDESFDELLEIEKTGVHPRKNKSRLLTDDEIEDYSEILGDTETWMDKGTVEEAEAAVKRQKDYEQQMYSEYQVEKQGRKELEDAYKEIDFRMTGEDTKYEANELADMIAETRFKTEMSDLPQNTQLNLYDEAYNYLMELKRDAGNFKGAVDIKSGKNIVTGEQEIPIDPMTGKPRKPNAKGGRIKLKKGGLSHILGV